MSEEHIESYPLEDIEQRDSGTAITAGAPVQDAAIEPDSDIEVVIEPTPPERKPRAREDFKPSYVPDDELGEYSDKVKHRISQLTFASKELERQRDSLRAERDVALQYGQAAARQYDGLRKQLAGTQKQTLAVSGQNVAAQLQQAQEELRQAHELAQFDKIGPLTARVSELAAWKGELARVPEPKEEFIPALPAPPTPQPQIDARQQAWLEKNNHWFRLGMQGGAPVPQNPMTAYALSVHDQLAQQNVAPGSERYYQSIDSEMRQRFPEQFQNGAPPPAAEQRRVASPVAPVVRTSSTGKRTVTLSEHQQSIARRLGVSLHDYAAQLATGDD